MKKEPQSVFLVITSALVIDGQVARAGDLVEVSDAEARNFLHRGKARLATDEDGAPEGSGTSDDTGTDEGADVDLSKLNKKQLLEHAAALMIADAEKMTKAEILDALQRRQEIEADRAAAEANKATE